MSGSNYANRNNHLDLDPTYKDKLGRPLPRLTYNFVENDFKVMEYTLGVAAEIAGDTRHLGPIRSRRATTTSRPTSPRTTAAPSGTDPKQRVHRPSSLGRLYLSAAVGQQSNRAGRRTGLLGGRGHHHPLSQAARPAGGRLSVRFRPPWGREAQEMPKEVQRKSKEDPGEAQGGNAAGDRVETPRFLYEGPDRAFRHGQRASRFLSMQTVIIVIHLMIVLAMVGLILLQKSEGGGLGMGGGAGFMSSRGAGNVLSRTTAILAAVFFATSLVLSIMASMDRRPRSILDGSGRPVPT